MGHSWREMDPVGAAALDQYYSRKNALVERLADVPLSAFTVSELSLVMRLLGLERNSAGACSLLSKDFEQLENKATALSK